MFALLPSIISLETQWRGHALELLLPVEVLRRSRRHAMAKDGSESWFWGGFRTHECSDGATLLLCISS